jgi:hypothetical protein
LICPTLVSIAKSVHFLAPIDLLQLSNFLLSIKKEFYERLGHLPMYIKYIYQLYEMNRRLQNKLEAGHTLMLHARLLDVNSIKSLLKNQTVVI